MEFFIEVYDGHATLRNKQERYFSLGNSHSNPLKAFGDLVTIAIRRELTEVEVSLCRVIEMTDAGHQPQVIYNVVATYSTVETMARIKLSPASTRKIVAWGTML